jgi:single-strand DNA-binding protein
MSGINKVILVGHLGKDPEVRHLEGGVAVASFPLATSETFNKDGRKVEQTEWHNIVMWRGLADVAAKYLQKGKLVYIEGKLRTRSFEDKEGLKSIQQRLLPKTLRCLAAKPILKLITPRNPCVPIAIPTVTAITTPTIFHFNQL